MYDKNDTVLTYKLEIVELGSNFLLFPLFMTNSLKYELGRNFCSYCARKFMVIYGCDHMAQNVDATDITFVLDLSSNFLALSVVDYKSNQDG